MRVRAWRVGDRCDCYVDPRQKTMRLLGRWPCVAVQQIEILQAARWLKISLDGTLLDDDEASLFAWKDGFRLPPRIGCENGPFKDSSLRQMYNFWQNENRIGLLAMPWKGQLIHWDYSRPEKLYDC